MWKMSDYSYRGYTCPHCGVYVNPWEYHTCYGSYPKIVTWANCPKCGMIVINGAKCKCEENTCDACKFKDECENYRPSCFKKKE